MKNISTGRFRIVATIFLTLALALTPVAIVSAQTPSAQVTFVASEPDAQGLFTLSMTVCNAKFNTFQFVLRYDKASVVPVDASGKATTNFNAFATKTSSAEELATIGTSIDSGQGLIDFTCYLYPGGSIITDDLLAVKGYANVGSSGLEVFTFKFKRTTNKEGKIEIASSHATKPYSSFLPQGAVLLDAGKAIPLSVTFDLPDSVGESSSVAITKPQKEQTMTMEERLRRTIALQIGNYRAALDGVPVHVDLENKDVKPYIDENNRTMVPIRFVAEKLEATVHWDSIDGRVTILLGSKKIIMKVGSKTYTVNGISEIMDTEPIIKKGWNRTMVPIRFVTEALGMAIEWDEENRLVIITEPHAPWQLGQDAEEKATKSILDAISGKQNSKRQQEER